MTDDPARSRPGAARATESRSIVSVLRPPARAAFSALVLSLCLRLAAGAATGSSDPSGIVNRVFDVGRAAGLPSGQVHAIAEDRRGLLWFATPAGLARFDGRRVVTLGRADGLTTQGLRALRADPQGALWIGSDVGLERRSPGGRLGPIVVGEAWDAGAVEDLAIAADGAVWVAAANGVRRCDLSQQCVAPEGFRVREFVATVAIDRDGRVWLASLDSGLHRLDPSGRDLGGGLEALPSGPPTALLASDDGGMIVAGERGLVELSAGGSVVRAAPAPPPGGIPRALLRDGAELWLGSDRGLTRLLQIEGGWQVLGEVVSGVAVNQLSLDASGNVWVATDSRGALMVSALRIAVDQLRLPCETQVFSLNPDGADVLVGGDRCSARIRATEGGIEAIEGLDGIKVWDLIRGRDGGLWAATGQGLLRAASSEGPFLPVAGPALLARPTRALLEHGGGMYVAGMGGLARIGPDGAAELLDGDGESLGYVYTLALRDDEVLAGALGRGLWSVTAESAEPVRLSGLRHDANVYAIDCRQEVGCAVVQDDEILLLHENIVTKLDSPTGDTIAGWTARFDAVGDLWLGGSSGLVRYRLPERAPRQRLTRSMGLPGNEFTTSRSLLPRADGTLLCGLEGGLGRVRSEELERFDDPPSIELLESRWRDARLESDGAEILVGYGRWTLDLTLFSPWHIDPENLRFHYRLLGLDDRWSELELASDRVRFSALPPGAYRLEAKAHSPLTGFGPAAVLIGFRVGPPWWLSTWFLLLSGAILLGTGAGIWLWRGAALRRRAQRLEAIVTERTETLRRANLELERMAHHDSLTGLPNRRLFAQRGEEFAALARRRAESFGLALLDVDHFKSINDEHGHDVGDEALRQIARTLEATVRRGDFLARLAGEEFVVLLAHAAAPEFAAAAERLRAAIEQAPLRLRADAPRVATASVGWSAWRSEGDDLRALLKRADQALYRAKRTRNAVAGDPPRKD